jgi:ankyrin repeat protein
MLFNHQFKNLNFKNYKLNHLHSLIIFKECTHLNLINTSVTTDLLLTLRDHYEQVILDENVLLNLYQYVGEVLTILNIKLINAMTSFGDNALILLLKETTVIDEECYQIIKMGIHINHVNHGGYNALYYAIKNHHYNIINKLLSYGVDVKIIYPDKSNILFKCLYFENVQYIKTFIEHGANIHQINNKGDTLLMYAIDFGADDIANMLIDKGINIHHFNKYQMNALKYAVIRHNVPIVNKLLLMGADIKSGTCKLTLSLAVRYRYIDIIDILYQHDDTIIDLVNNKGNTALLTACKHGRIEIIKHLIELKANINVVNRQGQNTLHIYFIYNDFKIQYLEEFKGCGMDFGYINPQTGNNLLLLALNKHCHIDIISWLLKYVKINHINNDDCNALSIALMDYQNLDIIKLLVKNNINLHHDIPLINAVCYKCNKDILMYLLSCDTDVNQRYHEQHVIHYIIKGDKLYNDVLTIILSKNIDINIVHEAYILAIIYQKMNYVNILTNYIDITNTNLFKLALNTMDYDVVESLIMKGANVNGCLKYIIDDYQDYRQLGIIYLLILNHADMNEMIDDDNLLMYCVNHNKDKNIIHLLIDSGCDINYEHHNTSSLSLCLNNIHHIDIVLKLFRLGVTNNINKKQWKQFCNQAKDEYKNEVDELLTYINV